MILYHAADLLWATRIKAAADAAAIAARPVRNLDMLNARLADSPVRALLVDLDDPDTALSLIARLRAAGASSADRAIRILAYGPHVAADRFAAARAAGADMAMARGALADRLEEVLRGLA
jgi:hypothetical protein